HFEVLDLHRVSGTFFATLTEVVFGSVESVEQHVGALQPGSVPITGVAIVAAHVVGFLDDLCKFLADLFRILCVEAFSEEAAAHLVSRCCPYIQTTTLEDYVNQSLERGTVFGGMSVKNL